MAKYIINIPDEVIDFMGGRDRVSMFVEPECKVGDRKHYALRLSKRDITPYTESGRSIIEDEVWGFVRIITDMTEAQRIECFGNATCDLDDYLTYQEAKARYEEWKRKNEIHIGDELKDDENIKAVVLDIRDEDYTSYEVFTENRIVDEWQKGIAVKTGRHFDEIEELLKKMRGELDDEE